MKTNTKIMAIFGILVFNVVATHLAIAEISINTHGRLLELVLITACFFSTLSLANYANSLMENAPKPVKASDLTSEDLKELEKNDAKNDGLDSMPSFAFGSGGVNWVRPLPTQSQNITDEDLLHALQKKRLAENDVEEAAIKSAENMGAVTFDSFEVVDDMLHFYDNGRLSLVVPKEALDEYMRQVK